MATSTVNRAANRPGTKAQVRFVRMSASKARQVLNLIRGKQVGQAVEILHFSERLASQPIEKCLRSAVANAEHNDDLAVEELFISACFADEGPTLKRFRPRARGRAGRIHKQTCHITIEVSRLTDDELDEARKRAELKSEGRQSRSSAKKSAGGDRARRVAKSRAAEESDLDAEDAPIDDQVEEDQIATDEVAEDEAGPDVAQAEVDTEEVDTDEVDTDEVDDASDDDAGDGEEKS